jgi:hypothetical protein
MKKYIYLSIICLFSGNFLLSQQDNLPFTKYFAGGGQNFQIYGNESSTLVDSLFANFSNIKRKGDKYLWKIKNVKIQGLNNPITFQVHQGVSGKLNNCEGYFHTFENEKYKSKLLSQLKDTEQLAVIIYVKKGRKYVLTTDDEAKIVKDYLLSIYQ